MQDPLHPVFARLNVWALSIASAVSAVAITILAWPMKLLMHHRMVEYGAHDQASYSMMHHGGSLWHLGLLVVIALWAGIGGAIVAAVYNAVVARQLR